MTIVNIGTASSSGASISFTGIPQTGKHLILSFSGVPTANNSLLEITYNGINNINCTSLYQTSSMSSENYYASATSKVFFQSRIETNPYMGAQVIIPFYASTGTKYLFRETGTYNSTASNVARLGFDYQPTSTAGINTLTITTFSSGTYSCSLEMVY